MLSAMKEQYRVGHMKTYFRPQGVGGIFEEL